MDFILMKFEVVPLQNIYEFLINYSLKWVTIGKTLCLILMGFHFYWPFQGCTFFVDHYLCLVFVMLSCLFIAALWSPAVKGLTSWLLFVMFNCTFVTFPCGILGQVRYLIVLIPDLCPFLTSIYKTSILPWTQLILEFILCSRVVWLIAWRSNIIFYTLAYC